MPLTDPPEGLDPFLAQHSRNVALRGFERSGEQAEQLEREAQEQRAAHIPGGGVQISDTRNNRALDHDRPRPSLIVEGGKVEHHWNEGGG